MCIRDRGLPKSRTGSKSRASTATMIAAIQNLRFRPTCQGRFNTFLLFSTRSACQAACVVKHRHLELYCQPNWQSFHGTSIALLSEVFSVEQNHSDKREDTTREH